MSVSVAATRRGKVRREEIEVDDHHERGIGR
jgi:hypothetical protein